jgi:hypothetical protein
VSAAVERGPGAGAPPPPAGEGRKIVLALPLTVEEARAVIWPFNNLYAPLGGLLDSGRLTYRDLGWALTLANLRDPLKAAVYTLLAARLGAAEAAAPADATEAADSRYGAQVVVGSRYLEDQEYESTGLLFGYLGFLGATVWWLPLIALGPDFPAALGPRVLGYLGLTLAIMGALLVRHWRRSLRAARGRAGEARVVEGLRAALDSRWTIFHNIQLPDRRGDLDLVLVGPGGVWVVEVKTWGGTVRVRAGTWERRARGGWARITPSPAEQARRNAVRLREFLQREGIDLRWVAAAIALGQPQPVGGFAGADPPVWHVPTLAADVAALRTDPVPPLAVLTQIEAVLHREATRALAREAAR